MFQLVARAPKGRLLFRTHLEARALWQCLTEAFPEAQSLVVMPNHVHLDLPHDDPDGRLGAAMRAYARWRNHHRAERGPVWDHAPPAHQPADAEHARRLRRYTALNPVRAHLAPDVLAWPWSLHREHVGFGFSPGFMPERAPERLQTYHSRDQDTNPAGTALPVGQFGTVKLGEIVDAVCGVTRSFANEIGRKGRPRTLFLQTAWAHDLCDVDALAALAACQSRTVYDAAAGTTRRGTRSGEPDFVACVRAVGDARFYPLEAGDLRRTAAWQGTKYRTMW